MIANISEVCWIPGVQNSNNNEINFLKFRFSINFKNLLSHLSTSASSTLMEASHFPNSKQNREIQIHYNVGIVFSPHSSGIQLGNLDFMIYLTHKHSNNKVIACTRWVEKTKTKKSNRKFYKTNLQTRSFWRMSRLTRQWSAYSYRKIVVNLQKICMFSLQLIILEIGNKKFSPHFLIRHLFWVRNSETSTLNWNIETSTLNWNIVACQ